MSELRRILASALITLLLWGTFTWPLPQHLASAIPCAFQAYGPHQISSMAPGDHLQYLYYLMLAKDMLTGDTPWFYNLYEFNTGNDQERYEPDPYYFPFSALFAALCLAGGPALAWNLTGLITLAISYWATWKLARRYAESEWVAGVAALTTFAFVYRWASLLGGSPMGLAMMWIPLLMLGLDLAVREERIGGGILAGFSVLFALWTDMHVFFFAALLCPAWCLVAFLKRDNFAWSRPASYLALARALLPVLLLTLAALWIRHLHTQGTLAIESERTWREIALFSPKAGGLFNRDYGLSGQIYLGFSFATLVAAGTALGIVAVWRGARARVLWREAALTLLLLVGIALVVVLAMGPNGPRNGWVFARVRELVPYYDMMRQPAKIFCVLPPLLAVASVGLLGLLRGVTARSLSAALWLGLIAWMLAESFAHVAPSLTWLKKEQAVYAAVASDATARGIRPGAVVVPLWPGDTHYTSVYQVYAIEHRIRMINGYSPMSLGSYREDIFDKFFSINQGVLDDAQLDELLQRGIHYVLVHENLFPEQVSPYPVAFTLRQFASHPRLELVKRDQRVWAWRILEEPAQRPAVRPDWNLFFNARRWEAEKVAHPRSLSTEADEKDIGGGAFARLAGTGGVVRIETQPMAGINDLAWLVRARGAGSATVLQGDTAGETSRIEVMGAAWTWHRIPVQPETGFATRTLELWADTGNVDVDMVLLCGGPWQSPAVGETLEFGAARFFHAGFMDMEADTVTLQRQEDPDSDVLYGPKLPIETGTYEVALDFTSPAPRGTPLGVLNLDHEERTAPEQSVNVVAGEPARGVFQRTDNLPYNLAFRFLGRDDITIQRVRMKRLQ